MATSDPRLNPFTPWQGQGRGSAQLQELDNEEQSRSRGNPGAEEEEIERVKHKATLPKSSKPLIYVGKRRGGVILPTGVIKKKKEPEPSVKGRDEQSDYLAKVRRYQELTCTEEVKRTSLVK